MKIKTNRLIASGLMSLVFILELFITHGVLGQITMTSLPFALNLLIYGIFVVPVFAVLIGNPVFEKTGVKYAVVYSTVLYLCVAIFLAEPLNQLYGFGLQGIFTTMTSTTAGYYVLAAKAVLMLAALVIALVEPKEKVVAEASILSEIEAPKPEEVEMPSSTQEDNL